MNLFHGIYTALITPFKNNEIDVTSLARLVRWQLDQGIDGFVICGTTAESPTLDTAEKQKIIEVVRGEVAGSVPLILGTGTNYTKTTIANTQWAEKQKMDGVLVVTPYYNKPPQRGLVAHFGAVAECTELPIFLYNVPGRTAVALTTETIVELSQVPNIVGIKEATGDLDFAKKLLQQCANDFALVSGDDETYLEFMALGGVGVISVLSHVIPKIMKQWSTQTRSPEEARKTFKPYAELTKLLFAEANPIPVKAALQDMGIIDTAELRLPLVELAPDVRQRLQRALRTCEVLS